MTWLMKLFWGLRVRYKLWLRERKPVPSFCKSCGVDVRDFYVSDEVWQRVMGEDYRVLCYQCFCVACEEVGVFPVWRLEPLEDEHWRLKER